MNKKQKVRFYEISQEITGAFLEILELLPKDYNYKQLSESGLLFTSFVAYVHDYIKEEEAEQLSEVLILNNKRLLAIVKRAAKNSCCACCDKCLACDAKELVDEIDGVKS